MLGTAEKVHFVGIGGCGMSALALVLLRMGYSVSGSDVRPSQLTDRLCRYGAKITFEHDPANVQGANLVVYSTAIPAQNPELEEARRLHIFLWHRSELLAALMNPKQGIAVAGAHGKTTTTAMISLILEQGGLDPTAVIGGELANFGGNARFGKSDLFVAEACESDRSFLRYHPFLAVITNIEADHLEHYGGEFNHLLDSYRAFIANVKKEGCVVLCSDDAYLAEIRKEIPLRVLTYGLNGTAEIGVSEISSAGLGSSFKVRYRSRSLGKISLKIPGRHNILNSLAAMSVALEAGVSFKNCQDALQNFPGAGRRFEIIGETEGVLVVDDYAHHPTEIRATLQAAKQSGRRVICVFQPHRYTRTNYLMDEFSTAFSSADITIINKVYSAGEELIPGATADALAAEIRKMSEVSESSSSNQIYQVDDHDEITELLSQLTRPDDIVITMGAGDIWKVALSLIR